MRRVATAVVAVVLGCALVAAGWWAGRAALEPPRDPLATPEPVAVEVAEGTVGRSLGLSAIASWGAAGVVRAPVDGVVTSVDVDPMVVVAEGARIASVNLVPAFAAVGAVPVFRDMAVGVRGADAAQLEAFLARLGHDPGLQDGSFSSATARAVRAWQTAAGAPVTGTVSLGSLVFVPQLPARVRPLVEVGVSVAAGESLAEVVEAAPTFTMGLTEEQATLIPPGAAVRLTAPDGLWEARAGLLDTDPISFTPRLTLEGVDGAPVCADTCSVVPVVGESSYSAQVVIVPEVTGPVVPVGAVRTDTDGSRFIVTETGEEVPVEVLASADGQAVVEGVDLGVRVLLPAVPP